MKKPNLKEKIATHKYHERDALADAKDYLKKKNYQSAAQRLYDAAFHRDVWKEIETVRK